MSTNTTHRSKPMNNHGMTNETPAPPIRKTTLPGLLAIVIAVGLIVLAGAVSPSPAQPGTILNEFAKVLASDGLMGDYFSSSVAISGDTTVVGAPGTDEACPTRNNCGSGSAYVFVRDANGLWTQQAKLVASDATQGDGFGDSIAISGDTVIIGARGDDDNGSFSGSAYVFTHDANGVWTQQTKLLASNGSAGDNFGYSVAINGDTAVVGAPFESSAYIFTRGALGFWREQTRLVAFGGAPVNSFGISVSLSGDTALIGAAGFAYVFVRDSANVWTPHTRLHATDATGICCGGPVALSGDTAVIGATNDSVNGAQSGSAYVFGRDAVGNWTQQAKLIPSDGAEMDLFGISVAISGATVVVGAALDNDNGTSSGSAYTFTRDASGVWTQQDKLLASDGTVADLLGKVVAISDHTVIAAAPLDGDNGSFSGSAYIFDFSSVSDITGDGVVNAADLASLLQVWGATGGGGPADLNSDGIVNATDLAFLLDNWG